MAAIAYCCPPADASSARFAQRSADAAAFSAADCSRSADTTICSASGEAQRLTLGVVKVSGEGGEGGECGGAVTLNAFRSLEKCADAGEAPLDLASGGEGERFGSKETARGESAGGGSPAARAASRGSIEYRRRKWGWWQCPSRGVWTARH